jgi:hypothetical protein
MLKYSRRGFTGLVLALLVQLRRLNGRDMAAPVSVPQPDPGQNESGSTLRTEVRRYRADAAILFLGFTIYRRAGVGGGRASIEEITEGESTRRTLFFAASSDPKRANGVNRLGWIREVALETGSRMKETAYFGVLTSSPEESLEHARKSVAAPQSGQTLYNAVNGRNSDGHSRSAVTQFEFASSANWSDQRLIDAAQSTFDAEVRWRETSWPSPAHQVPPTFLFQVATLLKQRARLAAGRYVYSEQEYRVELKGLQESKGGRPGSLVPIRGKIRNQRTGRETAFRLWIEDSPHSTIPVRIEFQPRSFLRLSFVAVAA